jgi:hypothetical protein
VRLAEPEVDRELTLVFAGCLFELINTRSTKVSPETGFELFSLMYCASLKLLNLSRS